MAIIYGLWIECLDDEESLNKVASHFEGLSHQLFSGLQVRWKVYKDVYKQNKPYILVSSSDFDRFSYSLDKFAEYSEAGIRLCLQLLDAPDFVFARVGVDVDRYSHEDYIVDLKNDGYIEPPSGMIISLSFWEELNQPKTLREFKPGYLWSPYFGEKISLLQMDEYKQIRQLLKKLPH